MTSSFKPEGRPAWALGALIAATASAVVLSLSAWAAPDGDSNGLPPPPHPHGMARAHGGGHGHGGMFWSGRHLERMLDEVEATPAQRAQIQQIAQTAQADLKTIHEQGRGLHEQGLALWAQPQIDPVAAEKLRQQILARHDAASRRTLQAMLDVGKVLTAEQRAKVAEKMKKHQADHRHWGDRQPEGQ